MAYDMRDECCYKESSARVRRLARLVLGECNGEVIVESAPPTEGPSREPQGEGPVGGNSTATSVVAAPAPTENRTQPVSENLPSGPRPAGDEGLKPVEVRFEQVTALRNRFRSAEQARQTLDYVRRAVLGVPAIPPDDFDPKAIVVQKLDWTRPEELPSRAIARTLLSMPAGQPSGVVEDHDGWHVVLVHQRRPEPNRPLGAGPDSLGGWGVDWQTQDYNTAYLERKLFTAALPGQSTGRPTRIVKPQTATPPSPPLTHDRPRRLPEPIALDSSLSPPPASESDTAAGTNASSQIRRVNGILPLY